MKKFKTFDLPYGGKLYYVKNKLTKTTMVDLQFLSGSRVEAIPGLAHFTEHMFFTGTKQKNKKQISKQYFDFIDANAFTNGGEICFTGNVFTNEFGAYLNTVAEMITESTFSPKNVKNEIPVVQQEIAVSKDKFYRSAHEFNNYNICKQDYLKTKVLGSEKSVASITSKDVKAYVGKNFVANNLIAYVSSPMSATRVKNLLTKFSNSIPHKKQFEQLPMVFCDLVEDSFRKIKYVDIGKSYLFLNFKVDHDYTDRLFKLKFNAVLDMINNFTDGIQKNLRLEKSLVYGCKVWLWALKSKSVVTLYTECNKENVNEILKTTAEYINEKLTNGFTQAELDSYLRNYKYGEMVKEPRAGKYMNQLHTLALYGSVLKTKYVNKIVKSLTLKECNEIFKQVFANTTVSLSVYGDAKSDEVLTSKELKNLFSFN